MSRGLVPIVFASCAAFVLAGSTHGQTVATDNFVSADASAEPTWRGKNIPLLLEGIPIENMPVTLRRGGNRNPYQPRLNCPQTSTYTNAQFTGGSYTAQGGFAEQEIAAVRYVLPGTIFPIQIGLMEMIFAQLNAIETTTTEWSVLVFNGEPNSPQPNGFPVEFSSDGTIIPHIVMAAGTRGVNVNTMVDSMDPEQIVITNPTNAATHSFTVAFRIDRHHAQSANPCQVAPPSNRNAFPVTDNVCPGMPPVCCGSGYGQLAFPNENWLFAVNCGPNGCPPNGGWTRFSGLQADQSIFGLCFLGCRPRGDWVMRVTWDPLTCPPPDGACCFGTSGCFVTTQSGCAGTGTGVWRGPGTTCGTLNAGVWSGCIVPPNQPPNADAGPDQTVTDSDNTGTETIVVNGNMSADSDGFIASYRWSEGAAILQDGPALLSAPLAVGPHTLTLRVTDDDGATDEDTVMITVEAGTQCIADVDDGTGTGTPDGGVTIEDLLYYLGIFDLGLASADVDDGSGTGTPDGGVTIEDLLYYLLRFDAGC